MSPGALPEIEIFDHAGALAHGIDAERVARAGRAALPLCLALPGPHEPVLSSLDCVEVNLVDDPTIADVHERFMEVPGATDVITFQHGEVFISLETAARCAAEFGHPASREAALYLVHALLHLNGFEDALADEADVMRRLQEEVLAAVWPPE